MRVHRAVMGAGLAATVGLGGCSTAGHERPQPAATFSAEYSLEPGVNADTARLQERAGKAAVLSITSAPVNVKMDGSVYRVTMKIAPDTPENRREIIFVPNSRSSGKVLARLGLKPFARENTNVTIFDILRDSQGDFRRSGPSISVIGQEMQNPGVFDAAATEFCQSQDLVSTPKLDDQTQYAGLKEAVCNSLGTAADEANLGSGHNYASYVRRVEHRRLSNIVSHGHVIFYPLISRQQFDELRIAGAESAQSPG